MPKPLTFDTPEALNLWLTVSRQGQEILDAVLPTWMNWHTAAMETEIQEEVQRRLEGIMRFNVLVVIEADSRFTPPLIKVYADKFVNVHIARKVATLNAVENEYAENYLESRLPYGVKGLFKAGRIAAEEECKPLTVEAEMKRIDDLAELAMWRQVGEILNG